MLQSKRRLIKRTKLKQLSLNHWVVRFAPIPLPQAFACQALFYDWPKKVFFFSWLIILSEYCFILANEIEIYIVVSVVKIVKQLLYSVKLLALSLRKTWIPVVGCRNQTEITNLNQHQLKPTPFLQYNPYILPYKGVFSSL